MGSAPIVTRACNAEQARRSVVPKYSIALDQSHDANISLTHQTRDRRNHQRNISGLDLNPVWYCGGFIDGVATVSLLVGGAVLVSGAMISEAIRGR